MSRVIRENPWLSGMFFLFAACWIINFFWGFLSSFLGLGGLTAVGILTVIYGEIYIGIKYKKWDIPLLSYYLSLFLIVIVLYMISGLLGKKQLGLLIIMPIVLFLLTFLVTRLNINR